MDMASLMGNNDSNHKVSRCFLLGIIHQDTSHIDRLLSLQCMLSMVDNHTRIHCLEDRIYLLHKLSNQMVVLSLHQSKYRLGMGTK